MQASDLGRLGVTVVAGLAAWELGQLVAIYLIIGFFGDHSSLTFLPGNGFGQGETLALLVVRVVIAALVAGPVALLLCRLLWRDRSR